MSLFLRDLFDGTDGSELSTAHAPNVGANWFKAAGGGGNHLVINGGRAVRNNAAPGVWVRYPSTQAADSPDSPIIAKIRPMTVAEFAAVAVRCNADYTTAYECWFTNTGVQLIRMVGGVPTTLITQAFTWVAGTDYVVDLRAVGVGATVTVSVKIDGAPVTSFADNTGSRILSTGSVGIAAFNGSPTTGFVFMEVDGGEASANSLVINTPAAYNGYARSGTTGTISGISVTTTGITSDIEASFNGGAYATIKAAAAAGTHTGMSLAGQAQGQGTLSVRLKDDPTAVATVAYVTISDVFVLGPGDSRGEGRATNAQVHGHSTLRPVVFRQDDAWAHANDPVDLGTAAGSHWPKFAAEFMAATGLPPIFISVSKGSTDVAGSANTWAKPNADYAELQAQVTASGITSIKACLGMLGPNAVINATTLSKATYRAALDTLAANLAADLPGAPPLFVDVCGEVGTGAPPNRRAALDNIRGAAMDAAAANTIRLGPVLAEQNYTDDVHPQTDAAILAVGQRYYVAVANALYGASFGRGPRLVSAKWNVARNQCALIFDRNVKTGQTFSPAAFLISDAGSAMTVSSVAYHGTNPAGVLVNTSSPALGAAGTTTISLASGNDAVGAVVPSSADITLPSGAVISLPAEPIFAAAVAEAFVPTVTAPVTLDGSTVAAGLTNLRWAWWDQITPDVMAAPTDKGSAETTDGSGQLVIPLPNSALTAGQVGWLTITNSTGDPAQNPPHKSWSGPLAVN